ncbi:MAG: pyridoxal phosphate-dependent aminotransferase [Defluviitaleaceae bacterium]|nr:pyridoxal phosphate-dependent aminotransferase [Defluviitaleaceae bacterium]
MFENLIAERMERLQTEAAFLVLAKSKALEAQGRHIIHMNMGQPDFKTPKNIIDAGHKAMLDGFTGYTPAAGMLQARQAIAEYAARQKNIKTSADEVVIVPGAKPVIFYTMLMLVEPGDEVIYPNPAFPTYESCIRYTGGTPVPLKCNAENNFRLDVETLKKLITPKTKLFVINNPSNPTGGIFDREDILAIADVLKDRPDIFILSDEIYDRLAYDSDICSIASLPGFKDRTIVLDGFSKSYSMTGWRLGYGILHPELAKHMELLMINSNSCSAAFTQIAGIEALTGSQDAVDNMKAAFKERRDWLVNALNAIPGIKCHMPKGAFYVFPDISSFGLSSNDFASRLLDEAGVATISGSSFGEYGEGCIRLSYATSLDDIKVAVERINGFIKSI